MLITNPAGHYHFLKGIDPYSSGVVSDPGHEIIHVILRSATPWREGFERIDAHLAAAKRDRAALCGVQLRCPRPYTIDGFIEFNVEYRKVIEEWGLLLDGLNPVARTNVSPSYAPPTEPMMFAFSYTVAADTRELPPSMVIAGAGELRDGVLATKSIIRHGDTSQEAMREKAAYVMKVMEERLDGLGGRWDLLNQVNVYTAHPLTEWLEEAVLNRLGPARRMGIHWHHSRPPVEGIEFEMDMRGVHREVII